MRGWASSPVEVLIKGRQDVVDRAEGDHGGCFARDLAATAEHREVAVLFPSALRRTPAHRVQTMAVATAVAASSVLGLSLAVAAPASAVTGSKACTHQVRLDMLVRAAASVRRCKDDQPGLVGLIEAREPGRAERATLLSSACGVNDSGQRNPN